MGCCRCFGAADPSSNLSHIQNVSEWILGAEPPLNLEALRKKLEQLKDLAANLPNSTAVLAQAAPQLDAARELLDQAQDARWAPTATHSHPMTPI